MVLLVQVIQQISFIALLLMTYLAQRLLPHGSGDGATMAAHQLRLLPHVRSLLLFMFTASFFIYWHIPFTSLEGLRLAAVAHISAASNRVDMLRARSWTRSITSPK